MQLELRPVMNDPNADFNPFIFLTNAGAAFALNMSVFMLIGRTSALTMNVAGVIKVGLSCLLLCSLIHKAYIASVPSRNKDKACFSQAR